MSRPEPRIFTVLKTGPVTRNMYRVTLGGEGLVDFPPDQSGAYVKLHIPSHDADKRTFVRTYTIRHHNNDSIDIDFAMHGDGVVSGPATAWAVDARPGDTVRVGGPGPAKPLPASDGHFLLVGDMTALPAISVNLEKLGPNAKGHAVIEIQDEADRQDFDLPTGFTLHWLLNPKPGTAEAEIEAFTRNLPDTDELTYGWVACEFSTMRLLRRFLRDEKGLGPDRLYISSYWKLGVGEDDHRLVKRRDAEAQDA